MDKKTRDLHRNRISFINFEQILSLNQDSLS